MSRAGEVWPAPRGPQSIPRPDGARRGSVASWSGGAVLSLAELSPRIRSQEVRLPLWRLPVAAAVLVALFEGTGGVRVVLTRRDRRLSSHAGDVAFPGGHIEDGETPEATALREAREETAISPSAVEVIGRLVPIATVGARLGIVPVVGALPAQPLLRANPGEVEVAFDVPLAELVEPGVHREERWPRPGGAERAIHFFDLDGDTVWGATAAILVELLELATIG